MRLISLLTLPLALATTALAVSPRAEKLRALAKQGNGIIKLDSQSYDEFTKGPRDYSMGIVLTAMGSQFKCGPCQVFAPEYELVAKAWQNTKNKDDKDHFFAVLDFVDGQVIYQRLNLATAPTFQLWMPTEGPRASNKIGFESYDFSISQFKAEAVAAYLRGSADIPLHFTRPIDKLKLLMAILSVSVTAVVSIFAWPYVKVVFTQVYLWAFGTMAIILFMTSGYMWCKIRHPQYVGVGQNGQVNYVQGGYSNQLGAEVHIVSAMYGVLAFSAYTLAHIIPKLRDPVRQRLGVYVWTGISVVMLGVLMNLFSLKQGGYPFRFF